MTDEAWTENNKRNLRQLWVEGHSTPEIARRMHRTVNSVIGKVHRLGLDERPRLITPGHEWSAAEDAILLGGYAMTRAEIHELLSGRSEHAIKQRRAKLRKRPADWAAPPPKPIPSVSVPHTTPRVRAPEPAVVEMPAPHVRRATLQCQWMEGDVPGRFYQCLAGATINGGGGEDGHPVYCRSCAARCFVRFRNEAA